LNNKAVEGEPLRYILIVFLMAVVLSISFSIITIFNNFTISNDFRNNAETIFSKMNDLRYGNSIGSWDSVSIKVPKNTHLLMDNQTNCLFLEWTRDLGALCSENDLLNSLNLTSGTYLLTIYYGDIVEGKNLTLFFK